MNVLISACLIGVNCRYSGDSTIIKEAEELKKRYNLIPVCPEILGGMTTPREPAEKKDGKVITRTGEDVTKYYERGAKEVLHLAKFFDCKYAILKERSPSCGFGEIYDGTFSKVIIKENGILAELLEKNRIVVLGESQVATFLMKK